MICFPACKINLGLHILGRRADDYHNLETVFYPVSVADALEILPAYQLSQPQITLSGLSVSGDNNSNFCIKAWHIVKQHFPQLPAVTIHLHKAIPMGAGLGGGSADGAVMLMMLNKTFKLQLSAETLADYALQLGSDCPFFIYNKPCLATGRGEVLQPVDISFKGYYIYIIYPGIHIHTAEAFARLQRFHHTVSLKEIIKQPVETWKDSLTNDFEAGISKMHPVIAEIKQQLYQHGALLAAMSGSGSTLFGIFKNKPGVLSFPESFFTKIVMLA